MESATPMTTELAGKTALITGAGRGIGRALAFGQISMRGRLTERLGSAFEDMALEPGRGQTALVSVIHDHSHLYGILDRARSLGLELVSVQPSPLRQASSPESVDTE